MKALIILLAIFAVISVLATFLPDKNVIADAVDTIGANVGSGGSSQTDADIPYPLSGRWQLKSPYTAVDLSSFPGEEQMLFTRQGSDYKGLVYSSMLVGAYGESDALCYVCDGVSDIAYVDGNYRYSTIMFVGTHSASEEFFAWFTSNYEKLVTEFETDVVTDTDSSEESGTSLSGTWKFNNTVDLMSFPSSTKVSFTANGETFSSMYVWKFSNVGYILWYGSSVSASVYNASWTEGYQEITFEGTQSVSEEFYEWFTSNATQN